MRPRCSAKGKGWQGRGVTGRIPSHSILRPHMHPPSLPPLLFAEPLPMRNVVCCRLLVGAPVDKNLQPGTNRSGALHKCPVSTLLDDCEQVITDGRRSTFCEHLA